MKKQEHNLSYLSALAAPEERGTFAHLTAEEFAAAKQKQIEALKAAENSRFVIRPEWMRAIVEAEATLRFTAELWGWLKPAAQEEVNSIADVLTEIQNEYLKAIENRNGGE